MQINKKILVPVLGAVLTASFGFVSAASALTTTCTGTPNATNITWAAFSSGAVEPVAFLWGNAATTSTQIVSEPFGTYAMTLQATDASSSVATTTCSAMVSQAVATISSFIATPASIIAGQSSVLSWTVSNASTTSINNGLGVISSTSITVNPSVTTTYTLSATNPGGTSTALATVTVGTTTGGGTGGSTLAAQIAALLNQILALKAQIGQLLLQNVTGGGTGGTATSTPSCFNFGRDLKHGDVGDDVKALQQSLAHSDPTLFPPGLVTGFFGPKTEAALKMFQRRFGISASSTGFFGPISRDFFKKNCGKPDGQENQNGDDNDNHRASSTQNSSSTNPFVNGDDNGKGKGNGKGNGRDD